MYERADVELALAYRFNGGPWRKETAPDDDMPKGDTNPNAHGTDIAVRVDLGRAWARVYSDLVSPHVLYLRYGADLSEREIAKRLGKTKVFVDNAIFNDVGLLADAMNGRR